MARPKFSKEVCDCLIENYGKGIPLKYCADAAGIHRNTVTNWMRKGEAARSGKYRDFYLDMQRAKSKFISHHMQKIGNSQSWMASQYLLQVTDPDEYVVAEKQQIEANAKATVEAKVDMNDPRIQEDDLEMLKALISDKDDVDGGGDKPTTKS